ncbi:hypothetical protein R0135_14265 [Congregibacter variabilis]|uniref:Uncharacterized protein n=1 Tax=Congregibacter variabilis TaxID=3081200 RepID=A0ABZ0I332_9GAMM|nr:hypothetical protein R0135_14265 [Congregibacter sp. IMCC43200]
MGDVKQQNWFAVGLDIIVVIVGIFLGMQVTDWNETRKNINDSEKFLQRIHDEVLISEKSSSRVRQRRLDLIRPLTGAAVALFDSEDKTALTDQHCAALATSHYFTISTPRLPSVAELMSAGRMQILQDDELRRDLIKLEQAFASLQTVVNQNNVVAHNLRSLHPTLIHSAPFFDAELGEMQGTYICDLAGMRKDRAFLNHASENLDTFDAYLRDGLRPWSNQIDTVHSQLDEILGISHSQ